MAGEGDERRQAACISSRQSPGWRSRTLPRFGPEIRQGVGGTFACVVGGGYSRSAEDAGDPPFAPRCVRPIPIQRLRLLQDHFDDVLRMLRRDLIPPEHALHSQSHARLHRFPVRLGPVSLRRCNLRRRHFTRVRAPHPPITTRCFVGYPLFLHPGPALPLSASFVAGVFVVESAGTGAIDTRMIRPVRNTFSSDQTLSLSFNSPGLPPEARRSPDRNSGCGQRRGAP